MCRNGALISQIRRLFGVFVAKSRQWLRNFVNDRSQGEIKVRGGGNGVDLGVQNVPKWGSEIADSRAV